MGYVLGYVGGALVCGLVDGIRRLWDYWPAMLILGAIIVIAGTTLVWCTIAR